MPHLRKGDQLQVAVLTTSYPLTPGSTSGIFVARLLEADTASVPDIVQHLSEHGNWAAPLLVEAAKTDEPKQRLHVSLARLPQDDGQIPALRDRLLDGKPVEVRVIRDALQPRASQLAADLWAELDNRAEPPRRRFRAACALAAFDPSGTRWPEHAESVAAWLAAENLIVDPDFLLDQIGGAPLGIDRQLERRFREQEVKSRQQENDGADDDQSVFQEFFHFVPSK